MLQAIDHDIENTVFSFIPNTAEVSFLGMMEGMNQYVRNYQKEILLNHDNNVSDPELEAILNMHPRFEKLSVKDAKLRTFITQDADRQDMVQHVYDTTYGVVRSHQDTIVAIDDSIVRGTTLKQSILTILDRLKPTKIVIVSSAPQIRYPDCYGIDMSRMGEFVAFEAAINLLKRNGMSHVIDEVYQKCLASIVKPKNEVENYVKAIYEPFTDEEISKEIGRIIRPHHLNAELEVIFQTLDNLHIACPNHKGDWYFSGNYPTAGGNKVVNRAYMNWMEGKNVRAYFSR